MWFSGFWICVVCALMLGCAATKPGSIGTQPGCGFPYCNNNRDK